MQGWILRYITHGTNHFHNSIENPKGLLLLSVQVENAIEIAWNPNSDQTLKGQAIEFVTQLRSEPQGWQVCLSLVIRDQTPSEIVRHVALEVVNNAIQTKQIDSQGLNFLRDRLLAYLRTVYGSGDQDKKLDAINIQNKLTQTFTYLFATMYATEWTSFFEDILGLTMRAGSTARDNAPGIMIYLRILGSVHDEIADILVTRTSDEQRRDNDLKDLVRQRDARTISLSWQDILSQWRFKDDTIVNYCLMVVGKWVGWTDISLVVNDSLLNLLFELVGSPQTSVRDGKVDKLQDTAINTFIEIVGKKMSALDKLELIDILKIKDVISQLIESPALLDLRSTSNYDTDLAESVAKLVNNTMYDIIKALDGAQDTEPASLRGNIQLKVFLPYALRFFSDEYDEICSTVIPCLTDLLTLFRKKAKTNSTFQSESATMLPPILDAIIAKMKYDETSSWGNEDAQTDEAEFQELRKRLQILQQAVAAVDEELYINKITTLIGSTLASLQDQRGQLDWRDVDLAMHEMFLFGELAVKNGGLYSKTKPVSVAAEQLIGMMYKLVESGKLSPPRGASSQLTFT